MKKYFYSFLSVLLLFLLFGFGFQFLYGHLTTVLGNYNNFLADLLANANKGLGPMLVLASFLYGLVHAIGPGHGKFVLSSYSIATNIKFFKVAILALTISLLQGVTAVLIGSFALLVFESSVTRFVNISGSLVLVSSLMLMSLAIFWLGRAGYNIWKIRALMQQAKAEEVTVDAHAKAISNTCSGNHHTVGGDSVSACTSSKEHQSRVTDNVKKSCCEHHHDHKHHHHNHGYHEHHHHHQGCQHHVHSQHSDHHECSHDHQGCGCSHHLNWNDFAQLDNFRDRLIMSISVILRPCTGAIFVLIFAYSINQWWWGVASAMIMALGTGLGLLFTVQLVTLIKKLGFDRFKTKNTPQKALLIQVFLAILALALLAVTAQSAYLSYKGEDGNRVFQRSVNQPLLPQKSSDSPPLLLEKDTEPGTNAE